MDGSLRRMGLLEPKKSDCVCSKLGGTTDLQLIRPKERTNQLQILFFEVLNHVRDHGFFLQERPDGNRPAAV